MQFNVSAVKVLHFVVMVLLAFAAVPSNSCVAQKWAADMFDVRQHDFKTVSRGANANFEFKFKNLYQEDVHVVGVRSSCGCTNPVVTKKWVKSGEQGSILAEFNTRSFIGAKHATITVIFDQPYYAEVQLSVGGNIRSDIVTQPGSADFGDIDVGVSKEIPIQISYAGRNDWEVVDVRGSNKHLEVQLDRSRAGTGAINYVLNVRLKDSAPIGLLQDQLVVVTNDQRSKTFSLPVSARVVPPVRVTPRYVSIGNVNSSAVVQQRFIVRGKEPFEIADIACDDKRFEFRVPTGSKKVHVVPFVFTGAGELGRIDQRIVVRTNLGEEIEADCIVTGTVFR